MSNRIIEVDPAKGLLSGGVIGAHPSRDFAMGDVTCACREPVAALAFRYHSLLADTLSTPPTTSRSVDGTLTRLDYLL